MSTLWRIFTFLGPVLFVTFSQAFAQSPDVIDRIRSQSLFFETFDDNEWQSRWSHSRDAKYNGRFTTDAANGWTNKGLKITEKNKYYGLMALLDAPVDPVVASSPSTLPLVVQYEVKYDAGITCGGSYIKLLTANPELIPGGLLESTPYSIMFGPDRCGSTNKIHLILRHRNPINGSITEKHLASPPAPETNDYTHVYTLRIFPDHKFEVLVDGAVRSSGNLLEPSVLQPSLLPPREVPDPDDKKPADWVDVVEIPDPDALKPEDWDDREMVEDDGAVKPNGWREDEAPLINDPAAKRPEDWDDDEDGVWEPNQIPNPKCKVGCGPWKRPMKRNPAWKGVWKPPLIKNPEYKGPWVQKTIPSPDYFEQQEPIRSGVGPIGAVALELWTIDSGYMFDNILISRDPQVAELALKKLWKPRHEEEVKAFEAQLKDKEQKEKARAKEEKEKKKAAGKGSRRGGEQLKQLTESVLELFEDGAVLAPLAPYLSPLLDYLEEQPNSIVLLVGLVPMLLLTLVMLMRGLGDRKEKKQPGAEAAAAPNPGVADAAGEAAAEPAADTVEGGEAGDANPPSTAAPEGAEGQEIRQVEDTANEIEEEQSATGPRRRTPRAA